MKSFPNESVFNNLLDTEALLGVSSIMYHSTKHFQSLFFHFSFTSLKAPALLLLGFNSLAQTQRSVHWYLFCPALTSSSVCGCVGWAKITGGICVHVCACMYQSTGTRLSTCEQECAFITGLYTSSHRCVYVYLFVGLSNLCMCRCVSVSTCTSIFIRLYLLLHPCRYVPILAFLPMSLCQHTLLTCSEQVYLIPLYFSFLLSLKQ